MRPWARSGGSRNDEAEGEPLTLARARSLPVKVSAPPGAILMWHVTLPSEGAEEMVKGCHSLRKRGT